MKGQNTSFTAADFARYHNGTMPANEMHALEKAALEDPFLQDALDGFVKAPAFDYDVADIKHRLLEKTKRSNGSLITLPQSRWWRAAAMFIVSAGAAYLFYQLNGNRKHTYAIARERANRSSDAELPAATLNAGSVATNGDSSQAQAAITDSSVLVQEAPTAIQRHAANEQPMAAARVHHFKHVGKGDGIESGGVAGQLNEYAPATREKSGLPYTTAMQSNADQIVKTDTLGAVQSLSDANTLLTTALPSRVDSQNKVIVPGEQPPVANSKQQPLSEVAVTGYGTRRKQKVSASPLPQLNGKATTISIATGQRPSSHEQHAFAEYLRQNATPVYDTNGVQLAGEVLLSFTITKEGLPGKITVLRSSCPQCESQAITLLKNGPAWVDSKNKELQVVIKF